MRLFSSSLHPGLITLSCLWSLCVSISPRVEAKAMQGRVLPPVGLTVPDWWRPGLEEVSGQRLALQIVSSRHAGHGNRKDFTGWLPALFLTWGERSDGSGDFNFTAQISEWKNKKKDKQRKQKLKQTIKKNWNYRLINPSLERFGARR